MKKFIKKLKTKLQRKKFKFEKTSFKQKMIALKKEIESLQIIGKSHKDATRIAIKSNLRRRFRAFYRSFLKSKNPRKEIKFARIISDQQKVNYNIWPYPQIKNESGKKTFIWFVPDWNNVWGGGSYTLFRFANHFSKDNIQNIIFIYEDYNKRPVAEIEEELRSALKNSKLKVIVDPKFLPTCDVAFATTWESAYHVKSFPYAKEKFYFMQDYECHFYAYGTSSMQAMNSYKFGFHGITGGTWLKERFESYGGKAQNYIFSTDQDIFYPKNDRKVNDKISRIFFYARPSTERRCFELGFAALYEISKLYPDVEIVIAGLNLKSVIPFNATMLGNLTLKQTGELYRNCDLGIAFSGTNLSYLPVELMASGCPVLTNKGPQTEWYCTSENSMLVDPVVNAVVAGFKKLYDSKELRQTLVDNGLKKTAATTWEKEMDKIYEYVISKL